MKRRISETKSLLLIHNHQTSPITINCRRNFRQTLTYVLLSDQFYHTVYIFSLYVFTTVQEEHASKEWLSDGTVNENHDPWYSVYSNACYVLQIEIFYSFWHTLSDSVITQNRQQATTLACEPVERNPRYIKDAPFSSRQRISSSHSPLSCMAGTNGSSRTGEPAHRSDMGTVNEMGLKGSRGMGEEEGEMGFDSLCCSWRQTGTIVERRVLLSCGYAGKGCAKAWEKTRYIDVICLWERVAT